MRVLPKDIAPDITIPLEPGIDPFEGDLMDRKPLAQALMSFFRNVEDPMVLALDGSWGTGKSTFVKMLIAAMKQKTGGDEAPFVVGYIDAFALDYVDDPFIPITHKIREIIKDNEGLSEKIDNYAKGAIKVLSKVLVGIGSLAVNFATQGALASYAEELGEKGIQGLAEKMSSLSEEFLSERMKSFQEDEQALSKFREALGELATGVRERTQRPMVIFIDELDRCRPSFAVSFIERVKHFFSVDNVVFVLVMQRMQVESSLRACYGKDLNAGEYLQKFVNFWFSLDTSLSPGDFYKRYRSFIDQRLVQFGVKNQVSAGARDSFLSLMVTLAQGGSLTLREMDIWVSNYALAIIVGARITEDWYHLLVMAVAFLKSVSPRLYGDWVLKGFPPHPAGGEDEIRGVSVRSLLTRTKLGSNWTLYGTGANNISGYNGNFPGNKTWKDLLPDLRMRFELFGEGPFTNSPSTP